MDFPNDLLIDQLAAMNPTLESYARVISHTSEQLTRGSGSHDFTHSEAVHQRLSQLLPDVRKSAWTAPDLFILIATAYLHDVGHSIAENGRNHGEESANMIAGPLLQYLFPSGDIQNQIAKICYLHDRDIEELNCLQTELKLDLRPCTWINRSQIKAHPRFLGAVFRLADELECNSDRMVGQAKYQKDSRIHIAAVRLDLESRSISLDFKHGTSNNERIKCSEYIDRRLKELEAFLGPYGLSFGIVDKLPETPSIQGEESEEVIDARFAEVEGITSVAEPIPPSPDAISALPRLFEILRMERAARAEVISQILYQRVT